MQNGDLHKHIRIHADEKAHSCDVYGKAFTHSSILLPHKRIHTDDKPHSCDVCG